MKLLQQLNQGLLLNMDLNRVLPGVIFFALVTSLNWEQLVSLDCHFVHFKGALVLILNNILLCLDNFIVAPHTFWWPSPTCPSWFSFQRPHLARLQEAPHILQNFLQADLTAASSVSEHVRQSPVADSGPDLAALSHVSPSESDSSPPCWCLLHWCPWWSPYHDPCCFPRPPQSSYCQHQQHRGRTWVAP